MKGLSEFLKGDDAEEKAIGGGGDAGVKLGAIKGRPHCVIKVDELDWPGGPATKRPDAFVFINGSLNLVLCIERKSGGNIGRVPQQIQSGADVLAHAFPEMTVLPVIVKGGSAPIQLLRGRRVQCNGRGKLIIHLKPGGDIIRALDQAGVVLPD